MMDSIIRSWQLYESADVGDTFNILMVVDCNHPQKGAITLGYQLVASGCMGTAREAIAWRDGFNASQLEKSSRPEMREVLQKKADTRGFSGSHLRDRVFYNDLIGHYNQWIVSIREADQIGLGHELAAIQMMNLVALSKVRMKDQPFADEPIRQMKRTILAWYSNRVINE